MTGLSQNGKEAGKGAWLSPFMGINAAGVERGPKPSLSNVRNVVSPYRSPYGEGRP